MIGEMMATIMDGMQIDYEPASNMVNDLTVYVVNSQINVIFLLISLTIFFVVLNYEIAIEVHPRDPVTGTQHPWEVELSETNPQYSWYWTRLVQFLTVQDGYNI